MLLRIAAQPRKRRLAWLPVSAEGQGIQPVKDARKASGFVVNGGMARLVADAPGRGERWLASRDGESCSRQAYGY